MLKQDRYIGGGKLYFKSTKVGATEVELAEVQDVNFKVNVTTKDAFAKDGTMKRLVAKVATEITSTISFSVQKLNIDTMAMAMLGTVTTETFAVGATLPDNTTATASKTIPVIKVGDNPIIEGQLRFVGDADGDTKPILLIYNAVITPNGDISYISEDFAKLSFEGAVLKTASGYANEYRMTVGA